MTICSLGGEMNDTILYMLTENSPYMMSFVICTSKNNVIVIDGARAGDMPLLKHYVGVDIFLHGF